MRCGVGRRVEPRSACRQIPSHWSDTCHYSDRAGSPLWPGFADDAPSPEPQLCHLMKHPELRHLTA